MEVSLLPIFGLFRGHSFVVYFFIVYLDSLSFAWRYLLECQSSEKLQSDSISNGIASMHRQEILYICSHFISFLILAGD